MCWSRTRKSKSSQELFTFFKQMDDDPFILPLSEDYVMQRDTHFAKVLGQRAVLLRGRYIIQRNINNHMPFVSFQKGSRSCVLELGESLEKSTASPGMSQMMTRERLSSKSCNHSQRR